MPMQKTSIMVIDTETIGLNREVYDVGIIVTDRKGKIIERYTRLVREIITDAKKMRGAFYTNRVYSHYIPMLDQNEITLAPWPTIGADIRDMVQRHNINLIAAYNLPFDLRVMKKTSQALGYGPILNSPFKLLDIWRFVCMAKLNTRLYKQLATERGWVSPAGNFKTGAEYAYRFVTGQWDFKESHTALSDAEIETEILTRCFSAKKKIPYNDIRDKYAHAPWRIVNEK